MGTSKLTHANPYSLPVLTRQKKPDTIIDTNRLLFKPLPLSQVPPTLPLSPLSKWPDEASEVDIDPSPGEWDVWEKLTERLDTAVPPGWDPHFSSTFVAPQDKLSMLTLVRSTAPQGKKHSGSLRELV